MRKTILIIGGLGYLGSRIAHSLLLTKNFNITLGSRNNQLALPKELDGCATALIDLLDKHSIQENLQKVDIIIHLVAMNANECEKDPSRALLVNSLGTLNLVQSIKNSSVEKIIYFSTAHVYGSQLTGNINEDTITEPSNHYAITHRVAEDYIINLGKDGRINTTVLRLSNAVGYPINKQANCWMLVANDIAKQIIEKKMITLSSSGNQLRDFIPISNIASALLLLIERNSYGELLNLGSGVSLSIMDLAKLFSFRAEAILGIDAKITSGNTEIGTDNSFCYKIDRIIAMGYAPVKSLENEIDSLLIYVNKEFGTKGSSK
jgi:UDP-glucose 4-epimerase